MNIYNKKILNYRIIIFFLIVIRKIYQVFFYKNFKKIFQNKYIQNEKPIQDPTKTSKILFSKLNSKKPCLISRFGRTEFSLVSN